VTVLERLTSAGPSKLGTLTISKMPRRQSPTAVPAKGALGVARDTVPRGVKLTVTVPVPVGPPTRAQAFAPAAALESAESAAARSSSRVPPRDEACAEPCAAEHFMLQLRSPEAQPQLALELAEGAAALGEGAAPLALGGGAATVLAGSGALALGTGTLVGAADAAGSGRAVAIGGAATSVHRAASSDGAGDAAQAESRRARAKERRIAAKLPADATGALRSLISPAPERARVALPRSPDL
jgi:hypothetical protein